MRALDASIANVWNRSVQTVPVQPEVNTPVCLLSFHSAALVVLSSHDPRFPVPKQPKSTIASASKPLPISASGSDPAKWQDRPKRKAPEKLSTSQNGNTDDGEGSYDEEDIVHPNAIKKPRLSKSGSGSGPSRTLLVKAITEMEASVKRVQASVAKEVEKMNGIMKSLNAKIKEMDEE